MEGLVANAVIRDFQGIMKHFVSKFFTPFIGTIIQDMNERILFETMHTMNLAMTFSINAPVMTSQPLHLQVKLLENESTIQLNTIKLATSLRKTAEHTDWTVEV